jgi:hypothetical protein
MPHKENLLCQGYKAQTLDDLQVPKTNLSDSTHNTHPKHLPYHHSHSQSPPSTKSRNESVPAAAAMTCHHQMDSMTEASTDWPAVLHDTDSQHLRRGLDFSADDGE